MVPGVNVIRLDNNVISQSCSRSAGFSGIELLGELGNRVPELCKEFDVPADKARVLCVEAAECYAH